MAYRRWLTVATLSGHDDVAMMAKSALRENSSGSCRNDRGPAHHRPAPFNQGVQGSSPWRLTIFASLSRSLEKPPPWWASTSLCALDVDRNERLRQTPATQIEGKLFLQRRPWFLKPPIPPRRISPH